MSRLSGQASKMTNALREVFLCRVAPGDAPLITQEVIEVLGREPESLWRLEKDAGWTEYKRLDLWVPCKDGVFSALVVFVSGDIQTSALIQEIFETFDMEY